MRTSVTTICSRSYFVMKFLPTTLLICSSFDVGTFATICLAQCWPVRSAILGVASVPLPPIIIPMTRGRRRSISSSGTPWIWASEKAKRAVISSVENFTTDSANAVPVRPPARPRRRQPLRLFRSERSDTYAPGTE